MFAAVIAATVATGCISRAARPAPDAGVRYRHLADSTGPWAIDILEVDLRSCWRPVALKAGGGAVGRATTSALLRGFADSSGRRVAGGVNADFFLFAPPGVPVGMHVGGGRLITGPTTRAVIAFGRDGRATIGEWRSQGVVRVGTDSVMVASWNRRDGAVRLVDPRWGDSTVAGTGLLELRIGGSPARVLEVDSTPARVAIPRDGIVLVVDSTAPAALRRRIASWRGEASWEMAVLPALPQEAVGGMPELVRDSAARDGLDRAGGANFGPVRHPRTAVGVAANGRRLLLVTVDGRQAGWSAGMTLPELAALMLRLGATAAINLDGGGSTAMVARQGDSLRVMNRPSDAAGERPVANVLAIMDGCAAR